MKNVTWQQVLVLVVCIAAPVLAFKFLDSSMAAGASMAAGMVLNFLLGRDNPPPSDPPSGGTMAKVIGFTGAAALLTVGCMDANYPSDALQDCRIEARQEYYVGDASVDEAMAIYEHCLESRGL